MTLPVFPNPISLNQVNVELGIVGTTLISLNQANVRTLAGVPSGTISMNNLHGKTNRVTVTFNMITGNVSGVTINSIPGYIAGITDAIINVPAGVYLFTTSSNLSFGGLQIYGGTAGDTLTINNSGAIMGIGGNGGIGGAVGVATAGSPGGPALIFNHDASVPVQLNNYAYILGGGGGGAGGRDGGSGNGAGGGGGGAGGGYGGSAGGYPGGAGGSVGGSGSAGSYADPPWYAGGGGGLVAPGSRTTPSSALSLGGSAGGSSGGLLGGRVGKYGGGPGEQGQQSNIDTGVNSATGAGGGGWGAAGGPLRSAFNTSEILAGGAAGAAIVRNGRSVTINNPGTIYGAIL